MSFKTDLSTIIRAVIETFEKIISYIINLLNKIFTWLGEHPQYSLQLLGNLFILFE